MINKLIILIFLVLFWWAFSGETEPFYIVAGIFSCIFALVLALRLGLSSKVVHKRSIFRYIIWLFKEMILSGLYIAKQVWAKKPALSPQFVAIKSKEKNEVFYAMFANSITMTPGTVTMFIDEKEGKLIVHAITDKTASDLKSGEMQKRIKEVLE